MKEILGALIETLYLLLPAALANMVATFTNGRPIHKELLGEGKTWRGLFLSPVVATILMAPIAKLAISTGWSHAYDPNSPVIFISLTLAIGFGAMVGDSTKSYFKRRKGIPRGEKWFPFDQLDFVVGGLVAALASASILHINGVAENNWFLQHFSLVGVVLVFVIMPLLHRAVNIIGRAIGVKKVPW